MTLGNSGGMLSMALNEEFMPVQDPFTDMMILVQVKNSPLLSSHRLNLIF